VTSPRRVRLFVRPVSIAARVGEQNRASGVKIDRVSKSVSAIASRSASSKPGDLVPGCPHPCVHLAMTKTMFGRVLDSAFS